MRADKLDEMAEWLFHVLTNLRMFSNPMPENTDNSHCRDVTGYGALSLGCFLEGLFTPGGEIWWVARASSGNCKCNSCAGRTGPVK